MKSFKSAVYDRMIFLIIVLAWSSIMPLYSFYCYSNSQDSENVPFKDYYMAHMNDLNSLYNGKLKMVNEFWADLQKNMGPAILPVVFISFILIAPFHAGYTLLVFIPNAIINLALHNFF